VFKSIMRDLEKFPGPAWDILTRIGKFALTRREYKQA